MNNCDGHQGCHRKMLHPQHYEELHDILWRLGDVLLSRIHLFKIEQTVGRTHLVHLAVDARTDHGCSLAKPKFFK